MLDSIATPCSVKTKGIADLGRLDLDVITNCDEMPFHSFSVSWNMKSSGKRFKFLFTA